jgi:hypothetical protein
LKLIKDYNEMGEAVPAASMPAQARGVDFGRSRKLTPLIALA